MFKDNPPLAALCLGTALTLAGCGKKKQTPIPTPPAPLPARQPAAAPPQQSPAPPQLSPAQPQPSPAQPQPSATQPPPARHRNRPSPMPVQSVPAPAPVEPPQPAPAAPPVLGTMLTPERKLALNREIDGSLTRARRNLSALAGKNLDAAGRETTRQVESFIQQAQTARASDLEASHSLAERADLLSRDLLRETGQ